MSFWGSDKPIIGPDTDDTKKGRKALGKDGENTFNQVGVFCTHCAGEDGYHTKKCPQNN